MTGSWHTTFAEHAAQYASQPFDAAMAAFLQPGYADARLSLRTSPKKIRQANHLMLKQGYGYLWLFRHKYGRQIAQCLGKNPLYTPVNKQLGIHLLFSHGDTIVTVFISGPIHVQITKSRKENPFVLGNLRRLNNCLPIRVGAEGQRPVQPAPATDDVEMLDITHIPKNIGAKELVSPLRVPANTMTTTQQQVVQSVWETILMARLQSNLSAHKL